MTSTVGSHTQPLEAVVAALDAAVQDAFGLAERVERYVVDRLPPTGASAAALADLREEVLEALADPRGRIVGAGFVAAVGFLEDHPWWLEWFVREGGQVSRLHVPLDPAQLGFYDYATTAWYRRPQADPRHHIVGPYVDHVCTEDQTLTFTLPVLVGGRFAGVAACDVRAATLEQDLLPLLRALPQTYAVVNRDGRVLCSNSGRYVCGDLLEPEAVEHRHGDGDLAVACVRPTAGRTHEGHFST